jgi:hypothetical protein
MGLKIPGHWDVSRIILEASRYGITVTAGPARYTGGEAKP